MDRNCTYTDSHGLEILHDPPVMNIPAEMYMDPRKTTTRRKTSE
jgi:hypothetical protein